MLRFKIVKMVDFVLCVLYHAEKYKDAHGTFQSLLQGDLGSGGVLSTWTPPLPTAHPSPAGDLAQTLTDSPPPGLTCAPACPTSSLPPKLEAGRITNKPKQTKSLMQKELRSCHRCLCLSPE